MFDRMKEDIQAIMARDPAAKSSLEILLCYPSLHAVWAHRLASFFWHRRLKLVGRWISQAARWLTGIEIHPGATLGRRFFIDHGMGVVIGESAVVGDDVTLYHGVTLGGVAPSVDSDSQRGTKRHPTLLDGVIVGSGAQILGPVTVGQCARVGANAVVVSDVECDTTVVGIPAKVARKEAREQAQFMPYAQGAHISDPVLRELAATRQAMLKLQQRVESLETERQGGLPGDTQGERLTLAEEVRSEDSQKAANG